MGCDIHCYIESRSCDSGAWWNFGGRINPGRDYDVFAKLAGVCGEGPLVPPRGMPSDSARQTRDDNTLYIVDEDDGNDDHVSRAKAAAWVESGWSKYHGTSWVTHPDWHSHSWLTPDEWENAIKAADAGRSYRVEPEYHAMLAAMRTLEAHGREVRVVFWFDN